MKLLQSCALLGSLALTASASTGVDVFKKAQDVKNRYLQTHKFSAATLPKRTLSQRQTSPYLNPNSQKFVVNGTGIPDVNFDIGESYAGLLPISKDPNESRQLFFWFFPSQNPDASEEIAIWLNGGPGCSSLSGLLTENGPFLFQAGTIAPTPNPFSWSKLTNYVWVEQPVGTGFSQGTPNITDEIELGEQFKGFWTNFIDTFDIKGRKTYITGESYGGFYVPYIANSFIEENNTDYFNLKGIAINDPIIGDGTLQQENTVVPYVDYWANVFDLNETFVQQLHENSDRCGYTNYTNTYLTYPPPPGPFPDPPDANQAGCDPFDDVFSAVLEVNPCFNIYHILDTCPFLYGHLGIVNEGDYEPPGGEVYFNRTDVQQAINAPVGFNWEQCSSDPVFAGPRYRDQSPGPALDGTLKNVIEKTNNTIIGSGALDFLLATNGTLFALQNVTWGGVQGLQTRPSTPFFTPDSPNENQGALAGNGQLGIYGTERGLTFYEVQLAGHELPGYSLGAGYRSVELMLGRIQSLSDTTPFTGGAGTLS